MAQPSVYDFSAWNNAVFPSKQHTEQVFGAQALSGWRRVADPGRYAKKKSSFLTKTLE